MPSTQYRTDVERLIRATEHRCELVGRQPSFNELYRQVLIRAHEKAAATSRKEIVALRTILTELIADRDSDDHPNTQELDHYDLPLWVAAASPDEARQLLDRLRQPRKKLLPLGLDVLAEDVQAARSLGLDGTDEDVAAHLAGASKTHRVRRQPKAYWQAIPQADLLAIDHSLSNAEPIRAFRSLLTNRVHYRALLRIFARTIWLTGMRPIELWCCRQLVPKPDPTLSETERARLRNDLAAAASSPHYTAVEQSDIDAWGGLGEAAAGLSRLSRLPPILAIPSAKQANANPTLRNPYRFQNVESLSADDLTSLCLAGQLASFNLPEARKAEINRRLNRVFVQITDELFPDRPIPLTLYSLRHDFVDRARRALPIEAAAALTGHTSRDTLYGYGAPYVRKGRARQDLSHTAPILPQPDPARVVAIRQAWGLDHQLALVLGPNAPYRPQENPS